MKDRLPKHPGRVKMTPVAGSEDLFDMVRADEPEEAGTPINKNTLLTDAVAEELGLDPADDPTPNDVLNVLAKDTAVKVGDIKETVRTDLGENWVLCNGDVVPEGELPALREMLHYNTAYKRIYPIGEYDYFRALPRAGQWFFCKNYNARGIVDVAYLYDSNTESWTTINCPNVATDYHRGIFGLTWDGERYILGVNEDTAAAEYTGNIFLFVSTDLKAWTQAYKVAAYGNAYTGCDLSFDGTNILLMERNVDSGGSRMSYINKAMTKRTNLTNQSVNYGFVTLPSGYWSYSKSDNVGINVYKAGSSTPLFAFSASYGMPIIAFFSDRYWLSLPLDGSTNSYIQVADLTTNAVSRTSVSRLMEAFGYDYYDTTSLCGAEYDRFSNTWMLYIQCYNSTGGYVYFIAYIPDDANPLEAGNYTSLTNIDALPESLYNGQMAPDGTQLDGTDGRLLIRNHNVKYLPTHDGETYKYIYAGGDDK